MNQFKAAVLGALKKATKLESIELEVPPDPKLGDYAFPCFPLAKQLKKSPNEAAKEIAEKIKTDDFIEEVKVTGPYLNFFINKTALAKNTIEAVLKEKEKFGSSNKGNNKKLILEHTSVNPNASPHVGRARNSLIGDVLGRLLKFQNYNVEVHYYVNDIGKQIAMLVLGARDKKDLTFDGLLKIYMEISNKVESDPSLEKEVLGLLKKLEDGDEAVKKEFKTVVDIAIKGQAAILGELDINYDIFDYESKYLWNKETDAVLKAFEKVGKFFIDKDDRFVLDLQGFGLGMKVPVLVLTRGDGTSLYALRDIAYTIEKTDNAEENVWVLGEDHKLYYEQIKSSLLLLEKKAPRVVHYSFVLLEEGKMSTRKGNLVLLEDFMKEAVEKASAELKKRYGEIDEHAAKVIGYGALKYSILKVSPGKNVTFTWDQALSFEGETAPYIQYGYARISSIIRKNNNEIPKNAKLELLKTDEEQALIRQLAGFPEVVEKAANELRPNTIATYAYELAKLFNEFYHAHNIMKEREDVKNARLQLIAAVQIAIRNSLSLLGIDVLERM